MHGRDFPLPVGKSPIRTEKQPVRRGEIIFFIKTKNLTKTKTIYNQFFKQKK
jgi:hypothetical protein